MEMTQLEPRDQTERWIAKLVPGKSFVDIGGTGESAGNERVSFAHRAGARSCTMADISPTTHRDWDFLRKRCASVGLTELRELGEVDIRSRESLKRVGKTDVVYSTGILYHLCSPADAIWSVRSIVGEYLITNTITFPGKVSNEFGTVELPDCGVIFLPSMTETERKVLRKHYDDKFGTRPGWKDIDHMVPLPHDHTKPHYIDNGELSVQPNWFYYSDNAFRALVRLCKFEIVDEWKWQDNTLQLLCRPIE